MWNGYGYDNNYWDTPTITRKEGECIFKPKGQTSWPHIAGLKGYAKYKNGDYVFKPNIDRFGSKNVYIVQENELEFIKDE